MKNLSKEDRLKEIRRWHHTLVKLKGMSVEDVKKNTSLQLPHYVKIGIQMIVQGKEDMLETIVNASLNGKE